MSLPYLNNFLLHLKKSNYSEETIYNYTRDLRTFESFLDNVAQKNYKKINLKDIDHYKKYLISEERKSLVKQESQKILSKRSINRIISALKSYFIFLEKEDIPIPINPHLIKLSKIKKDKNL